MVTYWNMFTVTWPQSQSKESPGLSSNRINAAPFPLVPVSNTRNELPTSRFPKRSSPFGLFLFTPLFDFFVRY